MHSSGEPISISEADIRMMNKDDLNRLRSYITSELGVLTPRVKPKRANPGPGEYNAQKLSLPSPRYVPQFAKPMDKFTDDHKYGKLSQASQHGGLARPTGRAAGMGVRDKREMGAGTRLPNVGPGSYSPRDPNEKPATMQCSFKFRRQNQHTIPDTAKSGAPGPGSYVESTSFDRAPKPSMLMTPATRTKPSYPAVGPGEYETVRPSIDNMSPRRGYADAVLHQ